jgi:cytidine deaminase
MNPVPTAQQTAIESLVSAARRAADSAYAPYSKFQVGAAVLSASGQTYAGTNVENAAYPVGTCAEQAALAAARLAEGQPLRVTAIAVYATGPDGTQVPCSPCGACRQRITELGNAADVWFFDETLQLTNAAIADLLPHAFTLSLEPT